MLGTVDSKQMVTPGRMALLPTPRRNVVVRVPGAGLQLISGSTDAGNGDPTNET
jgi:hypothetical protein